jgi:hypothetical protein
MNTFVHLFHIIFVSGLFFYVGVTRDRVPSLMYPFLLALGVAIVIYHGIKSFSKKDAWVNYLHILFIGPLLIYIGAMREKTPRKMFEILLMFAFASLGYHAYYMIPQFLF